MSTGTVPDYGRFSSLSLSPNGLSIDHYAKHEIWVRWLTAETELKKLREVAEAAQRYREYQRALAQSPVRTTPAHLDRARESVDEALARLSVADEPGGGA